MSLSIKERYNEEIIPALMKSLNLTNIMEVPRVKKVVVNVGVGEAIDNSKALDATVSDLRSITGQQPVVTKARTSIANFKLREGRSIGAKVTLRGDRMWSFLDRLMNIALPRVRDFRGVSPNAFDGRGNFAVGIKEADFPMIVAKSRNASSMKGNPITLTEEELFQILQKAI